MALKPSHRCNFQREEKDFTLNSLPLLMGVEDGINVADMYLLGWGVNREAWKWRMRLFAWEEELVREYVDPLTNVVLQVD